MDIYDISMWPYLCVNPSGICVYVCIASCLASFAGEKRLLHPSGASVEPLLYLSARSCSRSQARLWLECWLSCYGETAQKEAQSLGQKGLGQADLMEVGSGSGEAD